MLRPLNGLVIPLVVMVTVISCNSILDPVERDSEKKWQPFKGQSLSAAALNKPGVLHNEFLQCSARIAYLTFMAGQIRILLN